MTLIEAVISVLIVGVMLVAALSTLAGAAKARVVQETPSNCQALARQLLSEVMQAAYEDPETPGGFGPEMDEDTTTRADFDDVDDYDGWVSSQPEAKDGTPLSGCPKCVRFVEVDMANPYELGIPTMGGGYTTWDTVELKEIRVYVRDEAGSWYVARGLRSKFDAHSEQLTEEATVISWVGVDLEIGPDADRKVHAGVNLVNRPQQLQSN